jgi:hypothetical protein
MNDKAGCAGGGKGEFEAGQGSGRGGTARGRKRKASSIAPEREVGDAAVAGDNVQGQAEGRSAL